MPTFKFLAVRLRRSVVHAGALGWLALVSSPLRAQDWGGSVGVVSDQIYRGVSQTQGKAAIVTSLNVSTVANWWASLALTGAHVDAPGGIALATLELGRGWQLSDDWSTQVSLVHHHYPGAERGTLTYDELTARADWQGRWFSAVSVSPNTPSLSQRGWATSIEVGHRQRLVGRWVVDAGIGLFDQSGGAHTYGSLGLSWGVGPVQLGLTLVGSQGNTRFQAGTRWVTSALWSF